MDIEVGEYVRVSHMYKKTKIAKVLKVLDKDPCYHNMQMYQIDEVVQHCNACYPSREIYKNDIIKHSKNIIDLIEAGDYINGEYVSKVTKNYITIGRITYGKRELKGISSIVTKEQFESIEYRLED